MFDVKKMLQISGVIYVICTVTLIKCTSPIDRNMDKKVMNLAAHATLNTKRNMVKTGNNDDYHKSNK